MPLLTIGLPVYNGERYLEEALESILGQTFTNFRLVVSDNASTDATMAILEAFAARDERIVLFRSETNRGSAWNFNHVFEDCTTPYFKWAAADDKLEATCVERCLDMLESSPPSVVLAYPRTRVIDERGEPHGELVDALTTSPDAPARARFRKVVANVLWGNLVFAVIRTEALRRTRLHGSYPSSDHVLLAELALVGSFVEVPEVLFLRRQHAGMSRRANVSVAAASRFFDPAAKPVTNEFSRIFREHLAAIERADLSRSERLGMRATFLAAWAIRRAKLNPQVMRVRSTLRIRTRARGLRSRLAAPNAGGRRA